MSNPCICIEWQVRFTVTSPVVLEHQFALSLQGGAVESEVEFQIGLSGGGVGCEVEFQIGLLEQAFFNAFGPPSYPTPPDANLGAFPSAVTIESVYAAVRRRKSYAYRLETVETGPGGISGDLTPYLLSWSIDRRRNNPSSATFTLSNHDRTLRPWIDGHWNPQFDVNNICVTEGTPIANPYYAHLPIPLVAFKFIIRQRWRFTVFCEGKRVVSDFWFATDIDWSGDLKSITVQCTDMSELLLRADDQFMDDFITTSYQYTGVGSVLPNGLPSNINQYKNVVAKAKAAITTILKSYGIYDSRLNFEDFVIRHYSPKGGNALGWIKDILYVRQLDWWWEGNVFCASEPHYGMSKDHTLYDTEDIVSMSIKKSVAQLFNEVVVQATEKGGLLADQEITGPEALGYQEAPIDPPAAFAHFHLIQVTHGSIDEVNWYSKGKPIAVTQQGNIVATTTDPIDKVSFIYTPTVGQNNQNTIGVGGGTSNGLPGGTAQAQAGAWPSGLLPHYHITVDGSAFQYSPAYPHFDPRFWVHRYGNASQARYGYLMGSPVVNTILTGNKDADILATRLLAEWSRMCTLSNVAGPLQPLIQTSQNIVIRAGYQGMDPPLTWYTETVRQSGIKDKAIMELELTTMDL